MLVAFCALFIALQLGSYPRESATWDEPGHLLAGYAALVEGDYRPALEHPPLLRMWAALPLAAAGGVSIETADLDRDRPEAVAFLGPFERGHRFLYRDNDADRLLNRARFMVVLLGAGLGVMLFCWVQEWLGFRAGVMALALYLVEPNLAAHASLVTTDLGVTAFIFGAIYFLWRASRGAVRWNVAGLVACVVLAVLTKFSALVLGPLVVSLMTLAAWRRRRFTPAAIAGVVGLMLVATWVGVWAAYGFRYAPSESVGWVFSLQHHPAVQRAVPLLSTLAGWVDAHHLLPNAFVQGFLHGQALVQGRPAFLAGAYSEHGWWYYFPAAILFKTPVALLLLFVGGLVVCVRQRCLLSPDGEAFVVLPIGLVLAAAMTTSLNIGLRHVLPIYPFVIVLAALAAHRLLEGGWGRRGRLALAALGVVAVVEFAAVYPHNLAFFNVLAGGPHNGFRLLADSNVDWGQDLKALKRWMDDQGIDHINLAYFGTADPGYYGMQVTHLWGTTIPALPASRIGPPRLPGYVAVSVTLLDGVPFGPEARDFYRALREREPVADIGGSIRVYRVERPWW